MIMKKLILKIEDFYYIYGNGKFVLNGVNVDIYEGEKIVVIGFNGLGKFIFFLNVDGVFILE